MAVTEPLARCAEKPVFRRIDEVYPWAPSQFGFTARQSCTLAPAAVSLMTRYAMPPGPQAVPIVGRPAANRGSTRVPVSLVTCIDGVSAFCRVNVGTAMHRLRTVCPELEAEANFVFALFSDRSIRVKVGDGVFTEYASLDRGAPQGTIGGPVLFKLVVDSLIRELERLCALPDAQTPGFVDDLRDNGNDAPGRRANAFVGCAAGVPDCIAKIVFVADDMNIVVTSPDPARAIAKTNALLKVINDWARDNGLELGKLQAGFVSPHGHVGSVEKNVRKLVCGDLSIVPGPASAVKICGVLHDFDAKYSSHAKDVIARIHQKLGYWRNVTNALSCAQLREVYSATMLQSLTHAADAWWPYVSDADRAALRRVHFEGACWVAGLSPAYTRHNDALEAAGLKPLDHYMAEVVASVHESLLQHADDPAATIQNAFGVNLVKALQRAAPRDLPTQYPSLATVERALPAAMPGCAPNTARVEFAPRAAPLYRQTDCAAARHVRFWWRAPTGADGAVVGRTAPVHERLAANLARVAEARRVAAAASPSWLELWTDGSLAAPVQCGGGSYAVFACSQAAPPFLIAAGPVTSSEGSASFTPELLAIEAGLQRLLGAQRVFPRMLACRPLLIMTDSQSSLRSIESDPIRARTPIGIRAWSTLLGLLPDAASGRLGIPSALGVFVFGHTGLLENEAVDATARQAAAESSRFFGAGGRRPMLRRDAIRLRMANFTSPPVGERSVRSELRGDVPDDDTKSLMRYRQRLVAQVQSGACPAIGGHLRDTEQNTEQQRQLNLCPLCNEPIRRGGHMSRHLFVCPHVDAAAVRRESNLMGVADLFRESANFAVPLIELFVRARSTATARRRAAELAARRRRLAELRVEHALVCEQELHIGNSRYLANGAITDYEAYVRLRRWAYQWLAIQPLHLAQARERELQLAFERRFPVPLQPNVPGDVPLTYERWVPLMLARRAARVLAIQAAEQQVAVMERAARNVAADAVIPAAA